jgi:phage gp37-like protein
MMIGKLAMVVNTRVERKGTRKVVLSDIEARMGDQVIATRTIPGEWTPEQARKEFRRFPDRFVPNEGVTKEFVRAVAG